MKIFTFYSKLKKKNIIFSFLNFIEKFILSSKFFPSKLLKKNLQSFKIKKELLEIYE